jgi:hypothetical protein
MYREIITPSDKNNIIQIPKEYWNKQVEILVLPLNEMVQKVKQKKKNLQELLSLESIDIEEVRVSDWNIQAF